MKKKTQDEHLENGYSKVKLSPKWSKFIHSAALALYNKIAKLPKKDLVALNLEIGRMSRTNCWWFSYHLSDALKEIVVEELEGKE